MGFARAPQPVVDRIAYSIKEACQASGLCRGTIEGRIIRGELRAVKIGRVIRIPRNALLEFLGINGEGK